MAWPVQAELDTLTLPPQFSYRPYVPRKRNSTTATANAVVVQASTPQVVHGDGGLSFRIPAMFPGEFQALYDLYDTPGLVLYTFKGYWGEELEVYFSRLDSPDVRGKLFNVAGMFQVQCVTVPMAAECSNT